MNDQPALTPDVAKRALEAIARVYARGRKTQLEDCWRKGNSATGRYERLSPYYEDPGADIFWYAGYDGLTLQEAIILHDAAYDKGREAA